jgi:hypothetical protein
VATCADAATMLAADLLAGNEDPRRDAPELLRRTLGGLGVERGRAVRRTVDRGRGWPRWQQPARCWIGSKGPTWVG